VDDLQAVTIEALFQFALALLDQIGCKPGPYSSVVAVG